MLWWFANNHGKATTSSLIMQNVYLELVLGFKLGNALAMPTGEQDAGVIDSTAHAWGHEMLLVPNPCCAWRRVG